MRVVVALWQCREYEYLDLESKYLFYSISVYFMSRLTSALMNSNLLRWCACIKKKENSVSKGGGGPIVRKSNLHCGNQQF